MPLKGFQRRFPPLEILSEPEIQAVMQGILRELSHTGVVFNDERALSILGDHGCEVDGPSRRVRFPEHVVQETLAKCPHAFEVKARDSANSVVLGDPTVTYFFSSNGLNTVDLDTWEPRPPTRKEFYDFVKLLDALPNVHGFSAFLWYGFAKVPQAMCLIESCAAKMRMSTKVQHEGSVMGNDRWIIAMARATGQDVLQLVNPAAPLVQTEDVVSKILKYTQEDMPFHLQSGPVAGATGPATIAGSLVTMGAEHLSGIILAQIIKPGARVWSGSGVRMLNMRSGAPSFGQVGNFLADSACQQIWRRYGIPTFANVAAWTGSKVIDYQAAYETTMAATLTALSGPSVIYFHGGLTQQLSNVPVKAILDNDVAGMIGRFMQGIEVNEHTLALDVINQVSLESDSFLLSDHTRQWWKKEQYLPVAADHRAHEEWVRMGSKQALDLARERLTEILNTHKPDPLSSDQEQAIEDILNDARQYYRKKGLISDEEWTLYQEDLNSPNYPYA